MLGDALVAEPSNIVHDLKMVKSPAEIAYVRKAGEISDATVETLVEGLREGRTEAEVAAEIYHRMLSLGGSIPPTAVNFVSGERAAFSHGAPTERMLRRGDAGNAEYCVAYRRYCVSVGRQFSIGAPSARVRDLHAIVREAGDAAMAEIRDGVPAHVPFEAARRVIAKAGLDAYRVHVAGYGLAPGFPPAAGEPLTLAPDSHRELKAGMLLSVCPPVFIAEERIGARLVDNVLVTQNGAERITKSSRDLIVAKA
jgi:Xaa-Pro dipeptidase